jgi:DHA2 family multidrug resistance protein-like MFS transporter
MNFLKNFFTKSAETMTATQRWAALVVLSGALFVVVMDMTILFLALPDIIKDLNPDSTQQLWIVDVYSLILAGLLIPMSVLADRWGRKKILLAGFAIFGVVSASVFFVDTASHLIALRALLGVGGAMIMPATLSMIRTIFTDGKERATALAVWAGISGLGTVAGPLVGGLLLDNMSWHSAFLINVPFAMIAVIAGLIILPEGRNTKPPRWDIIATTLAIAGMSGLVWSIKELAKHKWQDAEAFAVLVAATLLLILFVWRSYRQKNPMLEVKLFKRLPFTGSVLVAFFSMFAMSAMLLLISQWMQLIEGWSPLKSGAALLPMGVGALLFAPLAPKIALKFGARTVLVGGMLITSVGMAIVYLASPLSYVELVPALVCIGMGMASLAVASAVIMSSTPEDTAGSAAAIEESVYELGNVFGVAIIGSIAAASYRAHLDIASFASSGVLGEAAKSANESVVGAQVVSNLMQLPDLAAKATDAFNSSIASASLWAAIATVVAAVVVFWMIPKGLNITERHE